jgi:hypothetical protein
MPRETNTSTTSTASLRDALLARPVLVVPAVRHSQAFASETGTKPPQPVVFVGNDRRFSGRVSLLTGVARPLKDGQPVVKFSGGDVVVMDLVTSLPREDATTAVRLIADTTAQDRTDTSAVTVGEDGRKLLQVLQSTHRPL